MIGGMLIFVPIGPLFQAVRLIFRGLPMFAFVAGALAAGHYLGKVAQLGFESPSGLRWQHLAIIPVVLLAGWVLFSLFRSASSDEETWSEFDHKFHEFMAVSPGVLGTLSVLALALGVWVGFTNAFQEPPPQTVAAAERQAAAREPGPTAQSPGPTQSASPTVQSPTAVPLAASLPRLQAIFHGSKPTAILSRRTVGVGDKVGEYQVVAITPTNVMVQHTTGKTLTLNLR